MKITKFEEIKAWQEARLLTKIVYKITFGKKEWYDEKFWIKRLNTTSCDVNNGKYC